jgi:GDP-4-dehydro-6-deoxy-D-mannose reductase
VEAYLALLARGRKGAVYNVCRGEGTSLRALVEGLVSRARVPIRLEVDPSRVRAADIRYLVGDPGLLQRETGWRPTHHLEQTLDEVLEEWRQRVAEAGAKRA